MTGVNLRALGHAMIYSSISFAVASVEIPDKFTLLTVAKTQEQLQAASDALGIYVKIGGLLALGSTLVLGTTEGTEGVIYSLLMNGLVMAWIYQSYQDTFARVAKKRGLEVPCFKLF
jgi:hypothetical protein